MALKSTTSNVYASMGSPSSPSSNHYYSAPSSPIQENSLLGYESHLQKAESLNSNFDDFEFVTGKSLRYQEMEFQRSQSSRHHRVDSLPMMAFADELFSNGLVLPLKPPPRYFVSSTASSPRSPSPILKISFSRQSKWDDEFDPFAVALENVREEKRGRSEVSHRRTRSLSPLRSAVLQWPEDPFNELAKPKKSASTRWYCWRVEKGGPKKNILKGIVLPNHNDSVFGRRGRSVKAGFGGEITDYEENGKKTKKQFLTKFASFGHVKNERKIREKIAGLWKKSSLGNLSIKLKERYGQNSLKRRM